jgi:hypothetical protein
VLCVPSVPAYTTFAICPPIVTDTGWVLKAHTTGILDRRNDSVALDEVERMVY